MLNIYTNWLSFVLVCFISFPPGIPILRIMEVPKITVAQVFRYYSVDMNCKCKGNEKLLGRELEAKE